MKFYNNILIIILITFTSCYNVDKPQKPNDLLSQDEMVNILVDIAIMSSAKGIDKKKIENSGIVPDEYIFKKHKIDSIRFINSNNYYAYTIEDYSKIYKKVKDSLTALRDVYKEIETKEKKEKTKRDSIYKVNNKIKLKESQSIKGKKIKTIKKQLKDEE